MGYNYNIKITQETKTNILNYYNSIFNIFKKKSTSQFLFVILNIVLLIGNFFETPFLRFVGYTDINTLMQKRPVGLTQLITEYGLILIKIIYLAVFRNKVTCLPFQDNQLKKSYHSAAVNSVTQVVANYFQGISDQGGIQVSW